MVAGGEPAPRFGQAHAELVLGLSGRNLRVRAGVDIGIHAHGGVRDHVVFARQPLQAFEFVARFEIETRHAGDERFVDFLNRLADAGKHDAVGGNSSAQCAVQFAGRDDVRADTGLRHQLQHGDVRIGLDRETDQRVEIAERGVQRADALADCRRGVGVARRAGAQRKGREVDAVEA